MLLGARAALWGRMRREFREEVGQWNVHSQPCSTGYFLFHFQSFFLSLCLSVSVCLSSYLSVSSSSISYTLCFILYYDRSLPRFPCFWICVGLFECPSASLLLSLYLSLFIGLPTNIFLRLRSMFVRLNACLPLWRDLCVCVFISVVLQVLTPVACQPQ